MIFKNLSIGKILEEYSRGLTPVDLVKETINLSEKFEKFGMWETFNPDLILKKAEAVCDKLKNKNIRMLEGIPVGVKDIYNTSDYPTQMGSILWKDFTPGNDSRVVFNLKDEGAIIAGKTVTAEFAVHELNKTLNPYDITKTPGTSSSGSAVAVALGIVPAALGTQTAGSIIRPASFCGVWGFKPSFGTIPRTGMLKTTDSLDTVGFFTIHPEDLKLVFDIIRVHGTNYPFLHSAFQEESRQNKPDNRPYKIAFVKTYTWDYAFDYAKESLENFVNKLGNINRVEIHFVDLPEKMNQAHKVHETIYNKSLSYYFQEETKKSEYISEIMNEMIAIGKEITIEEYKTCLSLQEDLCVAMDDFLKEFDAIICLSTAGEAPLRGVKENPDPSLIWTLTHLPSVNVPLFKSPNKLPFGLQVVSRRFNDYLLLNLINYLNENIFNDYIKVDI